jgi:hypothetical protein
LPRFFSQYFEHADDHRSRRRLQQRNAVAPGSASHRRPRIRDRRHPLYPVCYSIADIRHRSKLAVDHLDDLAGLCLAGEPFHCSFLSRAIGSASHGHD